MRLKFVRALLILALLGNLIVWHKIWRLSMEQIAAQVVQVYQGAMAHRKRRSASNIREDEAIPAGHSQNHSKP